jgi:uncharacterized protein (DUF1697 family)
LIKELSKETSTLANQKEVDTKKLYVAFVSKELKAENINDLKMSQFKPDEVQIDNTRIFIKYHIGAGKTRLFPFIRGNFSSSF